MILFHIHHSDILNRDPVASMVAWHLHILKDMGRIRIGSHGPSVTEIFMSSPGSIKAMKPMALDDSCKALSLADAHHIHELSGLKEAERHFLTEFIFLNVIKAEFFYVITGVCS